MFKSLLAAAVAAIAVPATATTISLDADTAATGSLLATTPLVTAAGTITFDGELASASSDADLIAAGGYGYAFDIIGIGAPVSLTFDFDVSAFEFVFGGNTGNIRVTAYDAQNGVVDEFFQANTSTGQFAGPVTLSGAGIRRVSWLDTNGSYAPLDTITITVADQVPEPAMLGLFGLGALGLAAARRRRKA